MEPFDPIIEIFDKIKNENGTIKLAQLVEIK
jgi:hypothetical protein